MDGDLDLSPQRIGEVGRLRWLYIAALSGVALLSLAGQILVQTALSQQSSDSRVINVSGRQRMLSQRLCKSALAISANPDSPSKRAKRFEECNQALRVWSRCHRALQEGDNDLGLPGHNSPEVAGKFKAISPYFDAMVASAAILETQLESDLSRQPSLSALDALLANEGTL
jgi:hypothetical protein